MEEQLKIDFEKNLKNLSYSDREKNFKENNFKEFLKQGFPNRKLENWKFSDLNQIIKSNIGDLTFYNDYSKENQIDKIYKKVNLIYNKHKLTYGLCELRNMVSIAYLITKQSQEITENRGVFYNHDYA